MAADWTVRPATVDDVPRIVSMLRHALGPAMSEELWRWKHERNPFGPSPCLVADAGSELVGVRAFMRWRWQSGSRNVPAVRAVDTATHPRWRGRGVFTELTESLARRCAEAGDAFVFNTPNRQSLPGYLGLGWRPVRRLAPRVRPIWRGGPEEEAPDVGTLLEQPWLEDLLRNAAGGDAEAYHTRPTRSYLAWRYLRNPRWPYRASWHVEDGGSAAAVFRVVPRRRLPELRICDLWHCPAAAGERAAVALLRRLGRHRGARVATVLAPRSAALLAVARRAGFWPLPPLGPRLTVRPLALEPGLPDPLRWESWGCSLGDLETF